MKRHCFETSKGKVVRDEEGRFFLCNDNSECKKIEQKEARQILRLHHSPTKRENGNHFTYPSIGEQWCGHRQYFELAKKFIQIGRNELAYNWEEVFRGMPSSSISYNFLHGIELGLKAFLLHANEGMLPIDIKDYGHDIRKLLKATKNSGLDVERPIVIPCDADEDNFGETAEKNWMEEIFGKASREDEQAFDRAIGINFERYVQKGTEYPISVFENQEYAHLVSVAGLAYTLFRTIRDVDGFFDQRQRGRHMEFEDWLEELHSKRRNYHMTLQEAVDDYLQQTTVGASNSSQ